MPPVRDVRMPKFPPCWESCGSCRQGDITVQSVLVSPGQTVNCDETLIVLETGKVALDIPSPHEGVIVEVAVQEFDPIAEDDLIVRIDTA